MKRINLILTPEIILRDRKDIAGTERVFINHLNFLSKKEDFILTAYYRSETPNNKNKKIFFPIWILNLSHFLQITPFLRKFTKWESIGTVIAQLIYISSIFIQTKKEDYFICYSIPLFALFAPEKTLVSIHSPVHFYFCNIWKAHYKKAHYLFCSQYLLDTTREAYPFLKEARCNVLSNAIDRSIFHPTIKKTKNQKAKFLYCGAWVKEKGFDILLDAFQLVSKKLKSKHSLTIASNPDLWYYEDNNSSIKNFIEIQKEKIKRLSNVRLLGGVSQEKLSELYNSHDWLLFPSTWEEPFGLCVVEAIACDLPVIHFGTGGVKEIVSNSNSIFVQKKSAKNLAGVVTKIIKNKVKKFKKPLWQKNNERNEIDYHNKQLIKFINKLK